MKEYPHLMFLWPSWIVLICCFRDPDWVKDLPQFFSLHEFVLCTWFFRLSNKAKDFFTRISFEISLHYMNCIDVKLKVCWCSEWFPTRITVMITPLIFMNIFDDMIEVHLFYSKIFHNIFEISLFYMNCVDVLIKISWFRTRFSTWSILMSLLF